MKLLSNLIRQHYGDFLAKTPGGMTVNYVNWGTEYKFQRIQDTEAKHIKCPTCKTNNFVACPIGSDYGVICNSCNKKNLYKYKEESRKHSKQKKAQILGMPKEFISATFKSMDGKPNSTIEALKTYVKNPEGYLLLAGDPGIGKTYSASAIMNNLASVGMSTRYIESMQMYQDWIQVSTNYQHLLESYQSIDLLVIDDFGHRSTSDAYREFLHMLFSHRKSSNKPTIIITNLNSKEMLENIDGAIFSRITSGIILKDFGGKDRRKKSW